jgi:hypothetical protein
MHQLRMQSDKDNLDPDWSVLLRMWREADQRVPVPEVFSPDVLTNHGANARIGLTVQWFGAASVAAIAIALTLTFGPRYSDDVQASRDFSTIVPELQREQVDLGPCSSHYSCISHIALLEVVNPR